MTDITLDFAAPRPLPPARIRTRRAPLDQTATQPASDDPQPSVAVRGDYEVGYGKPPKATQFKKGVSGNPKGRPRGAKGLHTLAREIMTEKVPVRTSAGVVRMSRIQAMLQKTAEAAMKGNPRAAAQLMALYSAAVPERDDPAAPLAVEEDLSATDLAILEAFKATLTAEQGQSHGQ